LRNAADATLDRGGDGKSDGGKDGGGGAGEVRVGWARSASPATAAEARAAGRDGWLEVWVDDDGPGIASGANLFVPFFTTKPTGSGIGLALGRQIAEAHHGTLTLANRPRGGASRASQASQPLGADCAVGGCRALLRLPLGPPAPRAP